MVTIRHSKKHKEVPKCMALYKAFSEEVAQRMVDSMAASGTSLVGLQDSPDVLEPILRHFRVQLGRMIVKGTYGRTSDLELSIAALAILIHFLQQDIDRKQRLLDEWS